MFEPTDMKQLTDPAFLAYLRKRFPGEIVPDDQDFVKSADNTNEARAEAHRLAQAARLIRLYAEWKTAQQ